MIVGMESILLRLETDLKVRFDYHGLVVENQCEAAVQRAAGTIVIA